MEIITAEQLMEYLGERFICIINVGSLHGIVDLTQYPFSEGFCRNQGKCFRFYLFEKLIRKAEMHRKYGGFTDSTIMGTLCSATSPRSFKSLIASSFPKRKV